MGSASSKHQPKDETLDTALLQHNQTAASSSGNALEEGSPEDEGSPGCGGGCRGKTDRYRAVDVLPWRDKWKRVTLEGTLWPGKRSVVTDIPRLHLMDAHAIQASKSASHSIKSLVPHLVAPAVNQLERARVLFRWIAENVEYDILAQDLQEPADVLRHGKATCAGYCNLYRALCREADLECETISGTSKGAGYYPGSGQEGQELHAWNRVRIDGKWYLCETTWAAGGFDYSMGSDGEFKKHWDELWFLVDPDVFVNRHLPLKMGSERQVDTDRQYIRHPVTDKVAWDNDIFINPMAEILKMHPITPPGGVVTATDNQARVEISCRLAGLATFFFATLKYAKSTASSKQDLNDYVMLYCDDNKIICDIRLPRMGEYLLQIQVKDDAIEDDLKGSVSPMCMKYTIKSTSGKSHLPYPKAAGSSWGRLPHLLSTKFQLLSPTGPVISTQHGQAVVTLHTPISLLCPVHVQLEDHRGNKQPNTCLYVERVGSNINIHAVCLKQAEYLLTIGLPKEVNTFTPVARFLLVCADPGSRDDLYPSKAGDWPYGPLKPITQFGLKIMTQTSTVHAKNGSACIDLKKTQTKPLAVIAKLVTKSDAEYPRSDSCVCIEDKGSTMSIHMHIPEAGKYRLDIYAGHLDSPQKPMVASLLVLVNKPWTGDLFPSHQGNWGIRSDKGLKLTYPKSSTVIAKYGHAFVSIECDRNVNISHHLVDSKGNLYQMSSQSIFALQYKHKMFYYLKISDAGMYNLRIFMGPPGGTELTNVANLLVTVKQGYSKEKFLANEFMWGHNDKVSIKHSKYVHHNDSVIKLPTPGKLAFRCHCAPDVKLVCNIITPEGGRTACHPRVEENTATINLHIPHTGLYIIKLWARVASTNTLYGHFLVACGVPFGFN